MFSALTMKNAVFWDVAPCGSCYNGRFRGTRSYQDVYMLVNLSKLHQPFKRGLTSVTKKYILVKALDRGEDIPEPIHTKLN
jgi:hypothetical protein